MNLNWPGPPFLVQALTDPRLVTNEGELCDWSYDAVDIMLGLLVPHSPDELIVAATRLTGALSSDIRKVAAIHLASVGRQETVTTLAALLKDPGMDVRVFVAMGVQRATEANRVGETFRHDLYQLLLEQCNQDWEETGTEAVDAVIALDRVKAARDFGSPQWLSSDNQQVHKVLLGCNKARIPLPPELLQQLIGKSLPRTTHVECYPHQIVVAAAAEALTRQIGERARPLCESLVKSRHEGIRDAAFRALGAMAGVEDPIDFALRRVEDHGVEGLTSPQRIVYLAFVFDAEVCNGGIIQFFGNSSGDHAVATLEALRTVDHPAAIHALETAMNLVGPLARESDRELRLTAFEDRFDELSAGFRPLEKAYYDAMPSMIERILNYVIKHTQHFR